MKSGCRSLVLAVLLLPGILWASDVTPPSQKVSDLLGLTVQVVDTNIPAEVARLANRIEQFAYPVDLHASPANAGLWTTRDGVATWRYVFTVPGAVSVSYHATNIHLPAGGTLLQKAGSGTVVYKNADLHTGSIWSRIGRGDYMVIEAQMPAGTESAFTFDLQQVQVGFRNLSEQPISDSSDMHNISSCTVNYACKVDSTNQNQGNSVIAIVLANTTQCTGNLVNNVKKDYKRYVLTASHCGQDSVAPDMDFYWNTVTPCGTALQSIYDSATATSFNGATATWRTGDTWLVEMVDPVPSGVTPYWAGFDATGTLPTFVYGVHDTAGLAKQYFESTNGAVYNNNQQWSLASTTGTIDHGGSGSALFDQNGRLIGTASGATTNSCPGDSSHGQAYMRLDWAWANDPTLGSNIQPQLSQFLDPDSSGTKVLDGLAPPATPDQPAITISAIGSGASVGSNATIGWIADKATSCTASGAWSGSKSTTGSEQVTQSTAGTYTYTLTCTSKDALTDTQSVDVTFVPRASSGKRPNGGGAASAVDSLMLILLVAARRRRTSKAN